MENKNNIHMKRSPSELALEMFIASDSDHKASIFGRFNVHSENYKNLGPIEGVTNPIEFEEDSLWSSKNIFSDQHHKAPLPVNSLSSVYVDSPISVNNSSKVGDSSHELLSDEEDDDQEDIEAGPCEQSTNPPDVKRMRRMKSNRDSARRSRQRKQAHLSDLQQQVEQLQGESASLFKQLALATQQFKDATTNNRVLRSDVEALRAKVKLAEDLVARGSLTTSLNHLLQNYLNTAHDCIDRTNLDVLDHNIIPAMIPSQLSGSTDRSLGPKPDPEPKPEIFNSIVSSGGGLDTEIWSWESLIDSPLSK